MGIKFSKEELDKYLNRHVKVAMKELKDKAYGTSSKKRLMDINNIKFKFDDLDDAVGQYSYYNLTIEVDNSYINNKTSLHRLDRDIIETLKHELLHHFVNDKFHRWEFLSNLHFAGDSSPIFLALLRWFKVKSGYRSDKYFKYSELYKEVMKINGYTELMERLQDEALDYTLAVRDIKKEVVNDVEISNVIRFGRGYTVGFSKEKISVIGDSYKKFLRKNTHIINRFILGCNIKPTDVKKLYDRKKYDIYNCEYEDLGESILLDDKYKNETKRERKVYNMKHSYERHMAYEMIMYYGEVDAEELEELKTNRYIKKINQVEDNKYEVIPMFSSEKYELYVI